MSSYIFQLLLSWLSITILARASVSLTGSTVLLNDIPYFIPPKSIATLSFPFGSLNENSFTALTVVEVDKAKFSQADLNAKVQEYATKDDVWQESFLECMHFVFYGFFLSCLEITRDHLRVSDAKETRISHPSHGSIS